MMSMFRFMKADFKRWMQPYPFLQEKKKKKKKTKKKIHINVINGLGV